MAFAKPDPNLKPLPIGTPAPAFDLPASGIEAEKTLSLADFKGQNLVLVFYPRDKTPGCTKQLCALQEELAEFTGLKASVVASNFGSLSSHESFAQKYGYAFPILVDAEKTMAKDYNVIKADGGTQRTVYIIDAQGVIRFGEQGMVKHDALKAVLASL